MSLLAGSVQTADMYCDDPGVWFFHCHINDHIAAGMKTFYTVSPNGLIQAGAGEHLHSQMQKPSAAAFHTYLLHCPSTLTVLLTLSTRVSEDLCQLSALGSLSVR